MAKECPFFQKECRENHCQLWVSTNDKNSTCAFAAIPGILTRDLSEIINALQSSARINKP